MIDLRRDIHLTPEDIEMMRKLEKSRSRSLSLNEYMDFLNAVHKMFHVEHSIKPQRRSFDRPFTLKI